MQGGSGPWYDRRQTYNTVLHCVLKGNHSCMHKQDYHVLTSELEAEATSQHSQVKERQPKTLYAIGV